MPSGLRGYNIRLDGNKVNQAAVGEGQPLTLTGLSGGVDYSDRITLTAVDNAGNESAPVTLADLGLSAVTTSPTAGDELPQATREAIDGFVTLILAPNTKCDGALVGVKTSTGSYFQAYGGDRTPNSPLTLDDKMRYGSVTKMYTGLLVLNRVDAGLLSLDDKLADFDRPEMVLSNIANADKITIKHLLMMQSGIKDYLQQDAAVMQQYFLNPTAEIDPMPLIRSYTPLYEPGTSSSYSNSNTVLLGKIAEWVDLEHGTGRDFRTIMYEDLLIPLGLDDTEWPTAVNMTPPYSRAWAKNEALPVIQSMLGPFAFLAGIFGYPTSEEIEWTAVHTSYAGAAGALAGTIADFVKFGEEFVGGALLSPDMVQLRNETFTTYAMYNPVNPYDGPGWMGYGLGLIAWGEWYGWVGNIGGYVSVLQANYVTGDVVGIIINHLDAAVDLVNAINLNRKICYLIDPGSTLRSVTQAVRFDTHEATATFGDMSVYVYHEPGDEDGNTSVPLKVPFYI